MTDPTAPGVTLGTAGHIDHGKTRLIAALTGVETDRLPEERRRGISIELGFAALELSDGGRLGIIDAPGHERLVRTMVAGASGIDMFLLVVAADDGVMPQTREHLDVLRALGVDRGVVALNKVDLVDAETAELAEGEIAELIPGAPIVAVSAERGTGIGELRREIESTAAALPANGRDPGAWPPAGGRMHVDRVFTIKGAGTVATGTVSGAGFAEAELVTVLPADRTARIRGIEVHGSPVAAVGPGRRAAFNLGGLDRLSAPRGSVILAGDAAPPPSFRLDVLLLGGSEGTQQHPRVQVHHGTRDVPARVVELGEGLAQLRLERPLLARAGDRIVLRSIAPPGTIGGGEVVDPSPRRHGPDGAGFLRTLLAGEPAAIVTAAAAEGRALSADIGSWDADSPIAWAVPRFPRSDWSEAVQAFLAKEDVPDADRRRSTTDELDLVDARLLALIVSDGPEPGAPQTLADELGLEQGEVGDRLERLRRTGHLVRVSAEVWYPPERLERLERLALDAASERGSVTLAGTRDSLGTSRKYAQALVEHLDRKGLTVRRGDEHHLRPSAEPGP